MVTLRLWETARARFQNLRPRLERFYYIRAWDFTFKKSEPKTVSAENFEVMEKIKLNKMHDRKCEWKLAEAHQYSALANASFAPLSEKLNHPPYISIYLKY